jgi:REP element-mobilizing transposase RayT
VARRIRIQYAGALYHVVSRGDRNGPIFADDADRESFLKTLDEARGKALWRIHAYVLMPDHFHLILKTPEANLVAGMKWLLGTYTTRFNVRHGLRGHLFAGRYKATPIDPRGEYLRSALDYVHLNPARAKLIQADQPLREFHWSSFGSYLEPNDAPRKRPVVEPALTVFGAPDAGRKSGRDFERHMEWRRTLDLNEEFQSLRHGWFFGTDSFQAELLARMDLIPAANHTGPEIHQSAEARAERIVTRELAHLEWSEQELREHAKGALEKIRIAEQLRQESTVTIGWIAERLRMGTAGHLSHLLYWRRRGVKPARRGGAGMARTSFPSARSESKGSPAGSPEKLRLPVEPDEANTPSTNFQPFTFDPSFD